MRISDWSSDVCSSDLPACPSPSLRYRRHVETLFPAASLGVGCDDLHRTFTIRDEAEAERRVRGQGNIADDVEDGLVAIGDRHPVDVARRRIEPGQLVHLHSVEVRMADHTRPRCGLFLLDVVSDIPPHLPTSLHPP